MKHLTINGFWFAYWRALVGAVMTVTSSTLGFAGAGLMFMAPYQTVFSAVEGGFLIGLSMVCAFIVAKTLKNRE